MHVARIFLKRIIKKVNAGLSIQLTVSGQYQIHFRLDLMNTTYPVSVSTSHRRQALTDSTDHRHSLSLIVAASTLQYYIWETRYSCSENFVNLICHWLHVLRWAMHSFAVLIELTSKWSHWLKCLLNFQMQLNCD